MKLSEMTMKQAENAAIVICDRVGRVADDPEFEKLLGTLTNGEEMPAYKIISDVVPAFVRFFLKGHRDDLYAILGAITIKTEAELEEMRVADVIEEVKTSIDAEMLGFFGLSGRPTRQAVEESVS